MFAKANGMNLANLFELYRRFPRGAFANIITAAHIRIFRLAAAAMNWSPNNKYIIFFAKIVHNIAMGSIKSKRNIVLFL